MLIITKNEESREDFDEYTLWDRVPDPAGASEYVFVTHLNFTKACRMRDNGIDWPTFFEDTKPVVNVKKKQIFTDEQINEIKRICYDVAIIIEDRYKHCNNNIETMQDKYPYYGV